MLDIENKKKYKLLVAGGILVGSTALWKLGTHRSHSNTSRCND